MRKDHSTGKTYIVQLNSDYTGLHLKAEKNTPPHCIACNLFSSVVLTQLTKENILNIAIKFSIPFVRYLCVPVEEVQRNQGKVRAFENLRFKLMIFYWYLIRSFQCSEAACNHNVFDKGQVALPNRMNFRKSSKGDGGLGGHFQSQKNYASDFGTALKVFFDDF